MDLTKLTGPDAWDCSPGNWRLGRWRPPAAADRGGVDVWAVRPKGDRREGGKEGRMLAVCLRTGQIVDAREPGKGRPMLTKRDGRSWTSVDRFPTDARASLDARACCSGPVVQGAPQKHEIRSPSSRFQGRGRCAPEEGGRDQLWATGRAKPSPIPSLANTARQPIGETRANSPAPGGR